MQINSIRSQLKAKEKKKESKLKEADFSFDLENSSEYQNSGAGKSQVIAIETLKSDVQQSKNEIERIQRQMA
jgi:hypothetical protein